MTVLAARGVQSEARLAFGGLQQLLRPVRLAGDGAHRRRTRPCSTRPWASETTGRRSTFASRWPFSTCFRTRQAIAPCCWSQRTPTGWISPRWTSSASSREGWNRIRSSCWPPFARATRRSSAPTSCRSFGSQPLDPASASRLLGDRGDRLSAGGPQSHPSRGCRQPARTRRAAVDRAPARRRPVDARLDRADGTHGARIRGPRSPIFPPQRSCCCLVAALNDSESLSEVLRAGSVVADQPVGVETLQPAADVAIVELDERTVRFRHPLMRSAVRQSASVEQRTACTRGARADAGGRPRPYGSGTARR